MARGRKGRTWRRVPRVGSAHGVIYKECWWPASREDLCRKGSERTSWSIFGELDRGICVSQL